MLAYAEMRSILTRIIWNFDMELKEDSMNWEEQKVYSLWVRPPLKFVFPAPLLPTSCFVSGEGAEDRAEPNRSGYLSDQAVDHFQVTYFVG
jgi:hypothetical protein